MINGPGIYSAVVLAAGKGVRMNDNNDVNFSKSMVHLMGQPLICFIIDSLIAVGIKEIVIIRRENDTLIESIKQLYKKTDVIFKFVIDHIGDGSLNSFYFAKNHVSYPFLLADCDIVCKKESFVAMVKSTSNKKEIPFGYVAVVDNPISLSEKMMMIDGNRVVGFNKKGIDSGVCGGMVYLFYKNPFDYCEYMLNQGINSYASFLNYLSSVEDLLIMRTTDMWDVDSMSDVSFTENLLMGD